MSLNKELAHIHHDERVHHDRWAEDMTVEDICVQECFTGPCALENRFILKFLGDIKGKRILDIGAGLGESSVFFAMQGAEVTAVDVSPKMIERTLQLAKHFGVKVTGQVLAGEYLSLPESSFDIIYLANTLHHVSDREALLTSVRQALVPGGRFVSIDPLAYNPLINVYRRMATEVRTIDERPFNLSDVRQIISFFPKSEVRMFWLLSQSLFIKYFLLDRLHPNKTRYWKRINAETEGSLIWWKPFRFLDEVLTRMPLLKWMAWNVVIIGSK